jgi:hypothetical protein
MINALGGCELRNPIPQQTLPKRINHQSLINFQFSFAEGGFFFLFAARPPPPLPAEEGTRFTAKAEAAFASGGPDLQLLIIRIPNWT